MHVPNKWIRIWIVLMSVTGPAFCAMTMKQLQNSMDMMRGACAPKFKVTIETLDDLRKGVFLEDKELKCYTHCIAQMMGTLTKKGEISLEKTIKQLEAMLPPDIKEPAIEVIKSCADVQKGYKDTCDKAFYSTKCAYEKNPELFMFP